MDWYTRAATEHQNAQEMYALARAYDTGQGGVTVDLTNASALYRAAAKDDNPDGMYYLAAMLANGRGGSRDFVQAWVWLTRAAKLGQGDAPAALAKLEAIMTPGDRAAAERGLGG